MSADDYLSQFHIDHSAWFEPSPSGLVRRVKLTPQAIDTIIVSAFNAGMSWDADRPPLRETGPDVESLKKMFHIS